MPAPSLPPPRSVHFKGGPEDEAVLCTRTRTYSVKVGWVCGGVGS